MKTDATLSSYFPKLPPIRRETEARARIRRLNENAGIRLIVLDDDPTGCQTVHDIQVLTTWSPERIKGLLASESCFYILTNSRALPGSEASQLNREIAILLKDEASTGPLRIVSRSDSTLRGHFPTETDALVDVLGPYDGIILAPYFVEGGRFTVENTHYVLQNGQLTEAAQTEFARDSVFGFKNSYLPAWVQEKSHGRWREEDVLCIDLDTIRSGGPEAVAQYLLKAEGAAPIVINSLCDEDLEIVVLGICLAENQGKRLLYRTAASFVKVCAGIEDIPLYRPTRCTGPGLVVVGSHVQKTTEQLRYLQANSELDSFELQIGDILGANSRQLLQDTQAALNKCLATNRSVAIYTQREYALTGSDSQRLKDGQRVSNFLVDLIAGLREQPHFIITKGGITSCDIAAKALNVEQATVMGQILPGVPVWRLGSESRYPDVDYVVFPGNVGDSRALAEAFNTFTNPSDNES